MVREKSPVTSSSRGTCYIAHADYWAVISLGQASASMATVRAGRIRDVNDVPVKYRSNVAFQDSFILPSDNLPGDPTGTDFKPA